MSVVKIAVGSGIYEMFYSSDEEKQYIVNLSAILNQKVNETIKNYNLKNQEYALLLTCLGMVSEQPQQSEKKQEDKSFSSDDVKKIINFLTNNLKEIV